MLRGLFKRKKSPADPAATADKERRQREAHNARREAELRMADQRQRIEAATRIDSTPPFGY